MTEVMLDIRDFLIEARAGLVAQQAQVAEFARQASNFTNLGVTGGDRIER